MKKKSLFIFLLFTAALFADATYTTIYTTDASRYACDGYYSSGCRNVVVTPHGIVVFTFYDSNNKFIASNNNGTTWTTPVTITAAASVIDVLTNATDDLFFTYVDSGIQYKKYTHTGAATSTTWTTNAPVLVNAAGDPVTIQDSTGKFWVVYNNSGNYYSRTSTTGLTWGAETLINSRTNNWDNSRSLAWGSKVVSIYGESYDRISWKYNDNVGGAWTTPLVGTLTGQPVGGRITAMSTTDGKMYYCAGYSGSNYGSKTGFPIYWHDTQNDSTWDFLYNVSDKLNDLEPVLTTTGTDIWIFWREYVAANQYNIVYQRYFNGVWQDKVSLITDGKLNYKLMVPAMCSNGFIPLIWKEGSGASYTAHRLKYINLVVPPVVSTCTPLTCENSDVRTLTITGKGFFGGTATTDVSLAITLDDPQNTAITAYSVVNDTLIQNALLPLGVIAGTYNVYVTNKGGSNTFFGNTLTVTSSVTIPAVTSFSPTEHISTDLSTLSINGSHFFNGGSSSVVKMITLDCVPRAVFSSYSVLNDSTIINAIIPANAFPGTCRVGVSSYGGTTRLGTYTVKPPVPIVTTVSPSTYSNLNDLQGVTINGQYFFGNTTIQRVATINLNDLVNPPIFTYFPSTDIKITNASLPAGVPCGVYDLKVTTVVSELYAVNASSGTKITVTSELPTVTNVNPSQVYNTDGGTVAITGTRFYGGTDAGAGLHTPNVYKIELNTGSTTYTVDSTPYAYPYTPLSINSVTASDALITGVSIPKGLLMGTYDVRVYNGMGANAASSVKLRITTRPPIVNTIVPNTGKDTAPRTISVTGTGFYGGLNSSDVSAVKLVSSSESVTIAPGVPGLSGYTVVSDSQLNNIIVPGSVTAKIESGAYDVIVVNTGGEGTSTTKYTCLIDSLDTASRTIASLDTQVTVSPGAFSTDTAVILNKSPAPAVQAVVDQGNNAKYVNLKMRANLGTWVWDLKNSVADISIAPSTATINPNGEVTLTISFAALSIPDSNIKKSLRLVTLNSKNRWELVDGTQTVDELADTLTVSLAHFSVYRLTQLISAASNLDGVKVFPNPVDMGASARNTVKFANLTLNPVISIYTISGEFVVTLTPDASNLNNDGASGKAEWDGKNSQGELVQRGMYIYLIRDDAGRKKSGKIVIK